MERAIWRFVSGFISLCSLHLCNGLPIGLDRTYGDVHTQYLTGLIAILLTICGVVCLAGCLCCQRRNGFKEKRKGKQKQEFHDSVVVESVSSHPDHGHVNPLAQRNEFTIFNPLTKDASPQVFAHTEEHLRAHHKFVQQQDEWKCENIDVRSWFNGNDDNEFPRTRLKYIRELGKGWFGRVVEGTAQGLDPSDQDAWKPVVVRILEASASTRQRILFLHDASIYRCSPHPNILLLLGRSLDNVPLLLLQEYSSQGDVKSLLRKQTNNKETFLRSELPLRWCYQLTSALRHLHSSNLVHCDLAMRNCRLTDCMDLKLGDYGCSTTEYPQDYYRGTENIPIRWCAPESVTYTSTTIQTKNVTQISNIWSLGVCLWEIYECGAQPYNHLSDDEVVSQVLGSAHLRLGKPSINVLFTDYMFRLMQLCWSNNEMRPTINQIHPMLEDLVQVHKHALEETMMPDFDQRWDELKPNAPDNVNVQFKLGPMLRTSSESETEEENWRRNVERGIYTEKVRQKSRSVADLMVLTHIEYSESDSETPLPSLNYKNVRYAAQNLENVSLTFGSEGNLLSVQNTFEEELRKLQEERRDSLLFVPASTQNRLQDFSTIEPANQIFNVYNVITITPNKIVNYNGDVNLPDVIVNAVETSKREIPKLSAMIENNIELMDYIIAKYDPEDECLQVEVEGNGYFINLVNTNVPHEVPDIVEAEIAGKNAANTHCKGESSESDEYVTANTHTVTDSEEMTDNTSASDNKLRSRTHFDRIEEETTICNNEESFDDETEEFFTPISAQNSDSIDEFTESDRTYCCEPHSQLHIETLQTVLQEHATLIRKSDNATIDATQDFLNKEILTYEDAAFTKTVNKSDLKFSLETWDNFLGQSFDEQHEFDDYSGEPMSLLFTEDKLDPKNDDMNGTYVVDSTDLRDVDPNDIRITMETDCYENRGFWEGDNSSGWYLHPQDNNDDLQGEIDVSQENESYVRFSMDDELMAAVRNELLMKLPHAQKASCEQSEDVDGEYETTDRNEVFLRYNHCYNTPLSPIPEESFSEYLNSGQSTPHCTIKTDLGGSDSDWSEAGLGANSFEEDSHSPRLMDSPHKGNQNRHTPSQESCCSNDTLFNLEELQCNEKQLQEFEERRRAHDEQFITVIVHDAIERALQLCADNDESENVDSSSNDVTVIKVDAPRRDDAPSIIVEAFLANELHETKEPSAVLCFAPLNSPEDRPWKHIEASLSKCVEDGKVDAEDDYETEMNMRNARNSGFPNENIYDIIDERFRSFDEEEEEENDPLADIRFTGPGDAQMMTTSFSESQDERDWDSGSDTRSSSSCEFIWKEGESVANVKALQAAPQELELPQSPEQNDNDESSSCSDEDGLEFVPSAWDKFATPTKSAMRSPEKSLDRMNERKGVSFKKQKYHCVYEYPREPEMPILQNYELWKDPNYIAWDLDRNSDPYLPGTSDYRDSASPSELSLIKDHQLNYEFTGSSTLDDDFYISSSSKPFDMLGSTTSQFFPGKHCDWSDLMKSNDNVTPDSGVEDITPGSLSDSSDYVRPVRQVLPLKTLAQLAANRNVTVAESNEIGRLRHTKNRLKLDLPAKGFSIDSPERHARNNLKFDLPELMPTFSTFGKSRFLVQQVDTSQENKYNVSFEALPYKPLSKQFVMQNDLNGHADKEQTRIEIVRGEASLLDSADEDSGIESCTLERRNVSEVSE